MSSNKSIISSVPMYRDKPSSIRSMDSSHSSNMERKESFMFSHRSLVSRGFSLGAVVPIAIGTAAALAMLSAGNARANMILNGDFSANAASYTAYPGGSTSPNPSSPTNWTAYTANGTVGVNGLDTGFYNNNGSPFAPTSVGTIRDFAFMQVLYSQIGQTVGTADGQAYTLSYEGAARAGETGVLLDVTITDATNNNVVATQTATITSTAFTSNTLTFVAPSLYTTVTFANATSPVGDNTVDVSNVSLVAVPEPAALGVFAIGGMGLLLLKRRKAV